MLDALIMFASSFALIFLRSYQTQVVVGGHYLTAFCVSVLMSVCNVISLVLIVNNGWDIFLPLALGGALGVVTAMKLYRKQHNKDGETHE